jgi:hypothetical protein
MPARLARAQGPLPPQFPTEAEPSDVDEVEEVVPDNEVLLPDEAGAEDRTPEGDVIAPESEPDDEPVDGAPDSGGKPRLHNIKSAQFEELAPSQEEVRGRYAYGAAVALGTALPWQSYSLSFYRLLSERWAAGLYVGGGAFSDSGTLDEQSYDLKIRSRSAGVDGRYYFGGLQRLSLQASLAYAAWSGNVEPNSADDENPASEEKLATAYDASGVTTGLGAVVTWLWNGGFYIDWTPVGIRKSWIFQKDQTRDSALGDKLVRQKVERPFFFGVTNIRFGMLF